MAQIAYKQVKKNYEAMYWYWYVILKYVMVLKYVLVFFRHNDEVDVAFVKNPFTALKLYKKIDFEAFGS